MTDRDKPYAVGTQGFCKSYGEVYITAISEKYQFYKIRMAGTATHHVIYFSDFTPLTPSPNTRGGIGSGLNGIPEPLEEYNTEDSDQEDTNDVPY